MTIFQKTLTEKRLPYTPEKCNALVSCQLTQGDDLPEEDPEAPHVTLGGKDVVVEALWSHPPAEDTAKSQLHSQSQLQGGPLAQSGEVSDARGCAGCRGRAVPVLARFYQNPVAFMLERNAHTSG